jgi:hypothetical protein
MGNLEKGTLLITFAEIFRFHPQGAIVFFCTGAARHQSPIENYERPGTSGPFFYVPNRIECIPLRASIRLGCEQF